MKRNFILFLLFVLISSNELLNAIDIFIVEPEVVSSSDTPLAFSDLPEDLASVVDSLDKLSTVHIHPIESSVPVLSLIDAGALAMRESLNYVLYGTVQVTARWCEARLSLYELETDSVRTVFYSKVSRERKPDLISELGRKLKDYLYSEFGIEERVLVQKTPGYFELSINPGYWMIVSPHWSDTLLGYFNGGISGKLAPSEPKLYFNGNEFHPRFGFDVDYALGRNRPGVENHYYHSIQVGLPLELVLELKGKHLFGLSFAPAYQFDFLQQERKYGESYSAVTGAFALKAALLYSFSPSAGNFSFGLKNQVDFTFYNDLLISYKPSLMLSYKFPFKDKSNES